MTFCFITDEFVLEVRSNERRNELIRFQPGVKTSSVHMTIHFGCISKRPDILMDMRMHFIAVSVDMIFYHLKWNFILVKMTNMKSIPVWVSFHLNSYEHKQRADWTPKWDFLLKWNLIPVWVPFASHVDVLLMTWSGFIF